MDRLKTFPVVLSGGLVKNVDVLTQGVSAPGSAITLQNYEPAVKGGYQRILGYGKFDTNTVPGSSNEPVTGVCAALGGVLAVRKTSTDNRIYFSSGSGWGSKLNASARTGTITRSRFTVYSIFGETVVLTDGSNPAWKYNGSTETVINGTGAPTNPKYATEHLKRLVLAGYSSNPNAISMSAPNNDVDFNAANGAVEVAVGDEITGIKSFRDTLYIFCKNSIYKLVGNTSSTFDVDPVTKEIGCVSGDTVQEVGGDLIFLAPDGLRSIAATERIGDIELGILSGPVQQDLNDLISGVDKDLISSCVIRGKSQYRLFTYKASLTNSEQQGYLGRLESRDSSGIKYAWSTIQGFPAYCAASRYGDTEELSVIGHATNGLVYKLETGNSFDGSDIRAVFETPQWFFGEDPELRKVLHKVKLYTEIQGETSTNMQVIYDFEGDTILQPPVAFINMNGGGSTYGSATYGTSTYATEAKPVYNEGVVGSGLSGGLRFTSNSQDSPHRFQSFVITYSLKGRR